ncbi:MAG TPA: antitoxin [Methylobacter sp.]|jgi:predicted DNA binding CopG/RHH family protein
MKTNDYTEEELELLEAMENKPLVSVPNLAQEMKQLKASVKTKLSKRKSINLRLLENDLQRIKTEAIKEGIPYQTLISSILHKYVQGDFERRLD